MKKLLLFILTIFNLINFSPLVNAQKFDDLNDLAFKERDNRNYIKAIDLCTQANGIKINTRSYVIRANCRYNLADYETAIDDYNSSLTFYSDYYGDNDKEKGSIYYFRGRCKQRLKKYNDAISDFNSALFYNYSEAGYAYWNRGSCYYNLGKYQDAEKDYVIAIDKISKNEDLCTLWKNRGDCKAKSGDYETAYAHYATAITYNPSNYNPYWQRGFYKSEEFKYNEALTDFNKAIEIINGGSSGISSNDLAILFRNKALMLNHLKQNDEALLVIDKSIETNPNYIDAYSTRRNIYQALKKYDKAKEDFDNSIALQTDKKRKSDLYLERSVMEWKMLDYKSSLADINMAIEMDPEDGMNFWHRAILYGYEKNYAAALKDCNTSIEMYREDSSSIASLVWLRASQKGFLGDFNGAIEDYRRYLKYYPESYNAYYEIGRLYKLKIKNNDLANANLVKAARMAMEELDTSKYCYIKIVSGNKDEPFRIAMARIENVKKDDYQYKWELHNMACFYSLAGNISKAIEYLEKSMEAGFDDYLHLINDRDLEFLMKQPQWKIFLAKHKVPLTKL